MKILMCNSYYYLRGGIERYFFDLAEILTAHGHEVIPFSMHHERNFASEYARYFVSEIDFPRLMRDKASLLTKLKAVERVIYSREAKQRIAQLIKDTQPDIAHVHEIADEISPSILPAIKRAGIPIVQTLHEGKLLCPNTEFVCRGEICERCKKRKFYNVVRYRCKRDSLAASMLACLEAYIHRGLKIYENSVDVFLTPSQFLQNKFVEYGFDADVRHQPAFVDPADFSPSYEPSDYFMYFGRLVRIKGVPTLLAAMQWVNSTSAKLLIIGEGELDASLKAYAQQHGLSNVSFLGYLNKPDLIPLIQRAAFTILPSECYENYPYAVIESFACGTPVIGARIGGIPELIKDGENGLLFESGNARQLAEKIQYMLDHPDVAIEMGRKGRQQVETVNNPQTHYERIIALYESLL
ncbi:MAG: glycosyltransferase family 4 protein [Anaerolineae bacterium]|nr:glycosyltransferase family 4 protein [Anaerolineae bacterium]